LEVKLIDFGGDGYGNGNDSEGPISVSLSQGGWQTIDIPIADITAAGLTNVGELSQITLTATGGTILFVDNLHIFNSANVVTGEQAVNGDFEVGDMLGWTLFDGGGIITAAATPGTPLQGGMTSGRLQAGVAQDVIFKQANLVGASIGDTIVVSFDLYGSISGVSGVVFGQFFAELSGGGTSADFFISPGSDNAPLTPTTTWTTYSRSITIASDVSGGVTLQLKAGCGAVEDCSVDAYFDNISIEIQ
jgi:hypothetical protein